MNRHLLSPAWLAAAAVFLIALPGRADVQYSAAKLNQLDKMGAFPPSFKKVVHDYVDVIQAIADAVNGEKKLRDQVPVVDQQTAKIQGNIDALNKVLADYNHTDESDFVVLQNTMNDPQAKPKDQLLLAQVFIWSYPTSSHLPQAQAFFQQVQKLIADRLQAEKDAAAAIAAARAKLLQRVQDKKLSMDEWKDFLNNMTQEDVAKYLGTPGQQEGYYWIYAGQGFVDPVTNERIDLRINFNGGRVVGVTGSETPGAAAPSNAPTPSAD